MAEVSIRELAESVGTPVDRLLVQLNEAGLPQRSEADPINDDDKAKLLAFLKGRTDKPAAAAPAQAPEAPAATSTRRKLAIKRRGAGADGKVQSTTAIGRKKTVTVEVKKRRTLSRTATETESEAPSPEVDVDVEAQMEATKRDLHEEAKRRKVDLDDRLRTEQEAREREEEKRREEEAERKAAEAEAAARAAEAEAKRAAEAAAAPPAESAPAPVEAAAVPPVVPVPPAVVPPVDAATAKPRRAPERPAGGAEPGRRSGGGKRGGRSEIQSPQDRSAGRRKRTRRGGARGAPAQHAFEKPTAPIIREVDLPETMTVGELAQKMSVKAGEVIKHMMQLGTMVTINQVIDQDTATIVVEEMGHVAKPINENALEDAVLQHTEEVAGDLVSRAPVVTIMGHVDHGKTSLLDYIRTAKVAAGEAGGITQHIGAYHVDTPNGPITFLDTPGHAAFTAMRARGAKATDLVILVVAADDGVMPQTEEAVQHSKAAGVPMVVAVNKIDREDADPNRVMQALSSIDVAPEQWGGVTQFVNVSAITGEGVDKLLEAVILQAELLELSAADDGPARGVVIESRLDRGRGPVASILVQSGRLRRGDMLLAGQEFGRVRSLINDRGEQVEEVGPSMPVEVLGLSSPPAAGDEAYVVADERKARDVAQNRQSKSREQKLARQQAAKLENVFNQMTQGEVSTLNLVVKADVQGSVEALRDALVSLSTEDAQVNIVSSGTGGITETDVNLAIAAGAIVIGFNVRADASGRKLVEQEGVDLHYFSVIYDVIDTVRQSLTGLLKPTYREEIVGIAQVRDVFRARRFGAIAGCMVLEGTVKRSNPIRVLRDNVVIFEGELESLRRFKEDVPEVKSGTECGIGVRNYNDVKEGDQIEVFEQVLVERSI
ncbi:MAG: translation initiation factor IF-2 [Gammaproteobacteria bacterium]|nr:translation initiation factor IF-2 [Gammaproteobacteria bacterium]